MKIKSKDSELSLETSDMTVTQRQMDIYFASLFDASDEFKSKIRKVEIEISELKSIDDLDSTDKNNDICQNIDEEVENDVTRDNVQGQQEIEQFSDNSLSVDDDDSNKDEIDLEEIQEIANAQQESITEIEAVNLDDIQVDNIDEDVGHNVFFENKTIEILNENTNEAEENIQIQSNAQQDDLTDFTLENQKEPYQEVIIKADKISDLDLNSENEILIKNDNFANLFVNPTDIIKSPKNIGSFEQNEPTQNIAPEIPVISLVNDDVSLKQNKEIVFKNENKEDNNDLNIEINQISSYEPASQIEDDNYEKVQKLNESRLQDVFFGDEQEIVNTKQSDDINAALGIIFDNSISYQNEFKNELSDDVLENDNKDEKFQSKETDSYSVELDVVSENDIEETRNYSEKENPDNEEIVDASEFKIEQVQNGENNQQIEKNAADENLLEDISKDDKQIKDNEDIKIDFKDTPCDLIKIDDVLRSNVAENKIQENNNSSDFISIEIKDDNIENQTIEAKDEAGAIKEQNDYGEFLKSLNSEIENALNVSVDENVFQDENQKTEELKDDLNSVDIKTEINAEPQQIEEISEIKQKIQNIVKQNSNLSFNMFLSGFATEEINEEFLVCAFYIKNILNKPSFTMKFINSNLFQATGKIADMSIVDELIKSSYIVSIEVDETKQYSISDVGEEYLINKFQS